MQQKFTGIRPFIGAKDFDLSRKFYRDLGFRETELGPDMSVFKKDQTAFYLQKAYVRDWIDNTMIFIEVTNVELYWKELLELDLAAQYQGVKLGAVRHMDWGSECFLHDPSGVLWHFGQFNQ
jgi:hypothetical protein